MAIDRDERTQAVEDIGRAFEALVYEAREDWSAQYARARERATGELAEVLGVAPATVLAGTLPHIKRHPAARVDFILPAEKSRSSWVRLTVSWLLKEQCWRLTHERAQSAPLDRAGEWAWDVNPDQRLRLVWVVEHLTRDVLAQAAAGQGWERALYNGVPTWFDAWGSRLSDAGSSTRALLSIVDARVLKATPDNDPYYRRYFDGAPTPS